MEAPKRSRSPRTPLNLRAEVRQSLRTFPATVRDFSASGVRLRGAFQPAAGERLSVTLLLAGGMRFTVPAEVRWVKEESEGNFLMGAKFVHTAESRAKVDQLARDASAGRLR